MKTWYSWIVFSLEWKLFKGGNYLRSYAKLFAFMDCGLLIFSSSLGFCCVEYSVCDAVANQGLPYSLAPFDAAPPATAMAKIGGDCTQDYITIEGGSETCGSPIFFSKFCGDVLGTLVLAAPPAVNNAICGKL